MTGSEDEAREAVELRSGRSWDSPDIIVDHDVCAQVFEVWSIFRCLRMTTTGGMEPLPNGYSRTEMRATIKSMGVKKKHHTSVFKDLIFCEQVELGILNDNRDETSNKR